VTRAALRAFLRTLLRIFFRRIELDGLDRLPASGPAVLVANHPSSLVDPILLLAFAPRPVAFLAKEPVFRMPVIGPAARALDAIPVHRAMDGADPRRNAETFERARALLRRGGVLALFPEGTSHDDPQLKPLKTGAARIALGAASTGEGLPLSVVPAGLVFTDKRTFRSEALLAFGAPIAVHPVPLSAGGEPAPADVRALTGRIQAGLDALVVQAESDDALALAASAEQLLSDPDGSSLAERVSVRQRLLAGRTWLAAHDPARLDRLERRLRRHLALLEATGLGSPGPPSRLPAGTLAQAALHLLLAPLALAGVLLHAPAWTAVDRLAHRLARGDRSMEATLKLGLGLVLFPATWLAFGVVVGRFRGAGTGLLAGLAGFFLAAAAVAFDEGSEPLRALLRAALLRLGHRGALSRWRAEREALRAELLAAADLIPADPGPGRRPRAGPAPR
jgi:glycerol-3-phosphate O-acyltransferase / dihydroxyacetone phosphate acyltransferase